MKPGISPLYADTISLAAYLWVAAFSQTHYQHIHNELLPPAQTGMPSQSNQKKYVTKSAKMQYNLHVVEKNVCLHRPHITTI